MGVGLKKDEIRSTSRLAVYSAMTDDSEDKSADTKVLMNIVLAAVDDRFVYSQFGDWNSATASRPLHVPLFKVEPIALHDKKEVNLVKIRNLAINWRATLSAFARLMVHRNNESVTRATTFAPPSGMVEDDVDMLADASLTPVDNLKDRIGALVAGDAMAQAEKEAARIVSNFSDAAIAVIALVEVQSLAAHLTFAHAVL